MLGMSTAAATCTASDLLEVAKEHLQKRASDMQDSRAYGKVVVTLEFVKGKISNVTLGGEHSLRSQN